MTDKDPQDQVVQALLDHIRNDPYPSKEQLAIIERALTPETAREYLDVLLEKAGQDRFPSNELLVRLERLASSATVQESAAEPEQAEDRGVE